MDGLWVLEPEQACVDQVDVVIEAEVCFEDHQASVARFEVKLLLDKNGLFVEVLSHFLGILRVVAKCDLVLSLLEDWLLVLLPSEHPEASQVTYSANAEGHSQSIVIVTLVCRVDWELKDPTVRDIGQNNHGVSKISALMPGREADIG